MRRLIGVAIAVVILFMLLGLLLSASTRVREAAARSKCQSNLCGSVLLLHSYASANTAYLPPGTVPNDDFPPEQRLSRSAYIVATFDPDAVLNLKAGPADERNRNASDRRIRHFICPSSMGSSYPVTHYVGIAGVGADAALLPSDHPRAGVFGYDRKISFDDGFTDGTSNTLILMETSLNPGHWAFGGPSTVRGIERNSQYIGPSMQFGGFHSYRNSRFEEKRIVVQVGMVDGSVRQIRSTIAPEVFEALATVAGKESLPSEW